MEDESLKLIIRHADPGDKDFIMDAWLKSQYYGNEGYFDQCPQHLFFLLYSYVIKSILFNPKTRVMIATDYDHPTWIAGFACFQDNTLFYVYVKDDFRKKGVAKLLVPETVSQIGVLVDERCLTKVGWALVHKYNLKTITFEGREARNHGKGKHIQKAES